MLNDTQTREIVGATAYDSAGDKIGKVGQLFLDEQVTVQRWIGILTIVAGVVVLLRS